MSALHLARKRQALAMVLLNNPTLGDERIFSDILLELTAERHIKIK